ncbi:MAG TPA: amylo-alpha-1,6-glucosidase [Aliidongia sp.]|nr:amylo-alpha-1,6-glucosidase [Aliidongia sp.]
MPRAPQSQPALPDLASEWLEADGLGGFASGTVGGVRTRRYHALLLTATTPPTGRVVLVNDIDAWIEADGRSMALASHRYGPDILYPDGQRRLAGFTREPWPSWSFRLETGQRISQELFVDRDGCETVLRWRLLEGAPVRLIVRPLLSGRDYHALQRESVHFEFRATVQGGNIAWRPYPNLPSIAAFSNGTYRHEPDWYRNFIYAEEAARGLDAVEDLASPGLFTWELGPEEPAVLTFRTGDGLFARGAAHAARLAESEAARRAVLPRPFGRSVEAYLVDRYPGRTILAGFPWFTDWGRDSFIALRGLCLATGRLDDAERILAGWAGTVSQGMLPNRFPDTGDAPEYNSVDAALWYIVACHDFLEAAESAGRPVTLIGDTLRAAVEAIIAGYAAGTRFGIGLDADGLLRAGEPGVQLTWMDAKVGDRVVTPRIGKPVEVQALWLNALSIAGVWTDRWREIEARGRASFLERFPDPESGGLFDVVDVDHVKGTVDRSVRPNQIFAVGGLPYPLLDGALARSIVALVDAKLLTPFGLRTLDPADPRYAGRYEGGPCERDAAYHQGTVWPWLIGAFAEAWLRIEGDGPAARSRARERFLTPLFAHLEVAGLGHVSEIFDGDAPHRPRGTPFQAWSLGELIRLDILTARSLEPAHA